MIKKSIFGIVFLLSTSSLYAQTNLFKIFKKIPVQDSVYLDTLSINPASFKIFDGVIPISKLNYNINFASTLLVWRVKPNQDSITLQYSTLPILLSKKIYNKDPKIIEEVVIGKNPFIYTASKNENSVFDFEGFNKSGSISRGISFGNNQNLGVNSNLVLQLSGKLNNEIEILAAISDENIPIQPDGNTQQLNDFDKVFIQLKRKESTLIAGDYELRRPDSYFTNYFKRTQGILINNKVNLKDKKSLETTFSAAVAKGRSARNLFDGLEGNQGPYRLRGNNGEQFIIVISGTERVFIDGIQLLRGQDNDYVMDYNSAEITFTSKRLITRNTRIVVEFEYSDRIFARSLYNLNQSYQSEKLKIGFNYYSEQDNEDKPLLQNLNNQQKEFLGGLGNQINQAVFPNVDSISFNPNEILYKRIDTLGASNVYVYSISPALAKYRVGFTFGGPNTGNYTISNTSEANGRVYVFVPSINGVLQGDYSPVSLLITPKKQQLVTLNANYKIGKKTNAFAEIGYSNNDVNLYSNLQNNQNKGIAYKLIFDDTRTLKGNDTTGLKLASKASLEYVNKQFKPLERYRPVEFDRDFNFRGTVLAVADEYWSTLNFKLFKNDSKQISYSLSNLNRGSSYNALQQGLSTNYQFKTYKLTYVGSLLSANSSIDDGVFYKNTAQLIKTFKNTQAGLVFRQEDNQTINQNTQQMALQSFAFREYEAFYKSVDTAKTGFVLLYNQRFDELPNGEKLRVFSKANTITSGLILSKKANSNLNINASYRTIDYLSSDSLNKDEQTLLGRVEYNFTGLKGFFNLQSFYELGTGQEPKREFVYIEVTAPQGLYAWIDYNSNGVRELNEFEIAKYPDQAKYIKIFRPNNEFVKSNFTNINQTLTVNPSRLFRDSKNKSLLFLSKFSNITSLRINKKALAGNGIIFNPYQTSINESDLISLNSFIRNTLFFNRSNPVFGFDASLQKIASKLLLTNGFDTRNNQEKSLRIRWNFIKQSNFNISFTNGEKDFASQLFTERNYSIGYLELQPEFGYQFNTDFKTSFLLSLKQQKNDAIFGGEKTLNTKIGSEVRYNILKKGTLSAQFNFINNSFEGQNNTAVSYELLDGLQPGKNLTWTASFQRTIANGIQLNFTYEGRKSNDVNTIHTGGLQVRAYF
jgi:hypothetical protein